jgi:hypothetical protein
MVGMADQPAARRRFQFRLRTLMIVVTLLAVNAGLWRAFGPPVRVQWVQSIEGREGWTIVGGHEEAVLAMVVQAGVVTALVLPQRAPTQS